MLSILACVSNVFAAEERGAPECQTVDVYEAKPEKGLDEEGFQGLKETVPAFYDRFKTEDTDRSFAHILAKELNRKGYPTINHGLLEPGSFEALNRYATDRGHLIAEVIAIPGISEVKKSSARGCVVAINVFDPSEKNNPDPLPSWISVRGYTGAFVPEAFKGITGQIGSNWGSWPTYPNSVCENMITERISSQLAQLSAKCIHH